MPSYSNIGKRIPRIDGVPKATGEATFAGDMISPDMLYGKILRSPHPHAKILNIDISKAQKLPLDLDHSKMKKGEPNENQHTFS